MTADLALECAAQVMSTLPMVMRAVGPDMHRQRPAELSFQQFGALMFISEHRGGNVSMVSQRLGLTKSSASKLVDGLVERGYVTREVAPEDRRRQVLTITGVGEDALQLIQNQAITSLSEILRALTPGERSMITLTMTLLRSALASQRPTKPHLPVLEEEQVR